MKNVAPGDRGRFDVQDRMLLAALLYQTAREWRDEGQFRPWKERAFALGMAAEYQERAASASKAVRVHLGIERDDSPYAEPVRVR